MSVDLGSAHGKINIDATGVKTGVGDATRALDSFKAQSEKISKHLEKVGDSLKSFGTKLTIGVTAPIVAVGGLSLKAAMDAVESENLFEVAMGGMAKSARDWSEKTAKALGLNAYELRKNTGMFYTMFQSMDIGKKSSLGMSEGLVQLANDMASFYNLDPKEAFEKLRSGIVGEVEPLRQLGILVDENTTKAFAYKNGIAKQGTELTQQQKVMARYGVIMKATGKAQGDLARTADSPTNRIRRLRQQAEQLQVKFGTLLIPIMEKVVKVLEKLANWFDKLSPAGKKMVLIFAAIAAVAGPLLGVIGSVVSIFALLIPIAARLGIGVGALVGIIALVVLAIVALIAIGVYLYTHWGEVKAKLSQIWEAIKTKASQVWESIKTYLSNLVEGIKNKLSQAWENVKNRVSQAWDSIVQYFSELPGRIATFLSQLPEKIAYWIGYAIGTLIRLISEGLTSAYQFFSELPGRIANFIADTATRAYTGMVNLANTVRNLASRAVNSAVNFFRNLPGRIWNFVSNTASSAYSAGLRIITALHDIAMRAVNSAVDFFRNLPGRILNFITSLPGKLYSKAKDIATSFWNGFKHGLGIHSPSLVEKAFMAISAEALRTVDVVNSANTKLGSVSSKMPRVAATSAATSSPNTTQTLINTALSGSVSISFNFPGNINVRSESDVQKISQGIAHQTISTLRGRGIVSTAGV